MSRARYIGDGAFAIDDPAAVAPGPNEVQIAVAYTGICGTDLHIRHGHMDHRASPPAVIGHEMSGRIAAIGAEVASWAVGDAVTVMPLAWCGACPACRAGHQHICHRLNFMGIDSPGSLQSHWTVAADTLVRLPDPMALTVGALVEPTAVAVHDVRRAQLRPGESVVVVGGGPVGLLIACVARSSGGRVIVVEPDAYRRRIAAELGLRPLDPAQDDVVSEVDRWTAGAGAAAAFEASGAPAGVALATDVLAVRGRLVLVAIHPSPREVNLHRFFWRELSLIGVRVYERPDFETAIELLHSAAVPAPPFISQIVPLAEVSKAFDDLERGAGVLKVLVDCRDDATGDAQ